MGHELSKFALNAQTRRSCGVDRRDFVEPVGQPHEFGVVVEIDAPHGVVDDFVADVHLLGQRFLAIVEHGTSHGQVFIEFVAQVEAEQCLALHGEHRLVFERHVDALTGIDDALVGDGDDAHGIIDGVVAVFGQHHSAGGHHNRSAGHVHCIESDLRTCRCLIFADEHEFVFVGKLTGHDECGVVEFLIDIVAGKHRVADFFGQM